MDRICLSCGEVEDEYYLIWLCAVCNIFDDLRKKYLPKNLYQHPSMQKFVNYLTCEIVRKLNC